MKNTLNLLKKKYSAIPIKKIRYATLIAAGVLIIVIILCSITNYINYEKCSQVEKDAIDIAIDYVNENNVSEESVRRELVWGEYDIHTINKAVKYIKQKGWTETQEAIDIISTMDTISFFSVGTDDYEYTSDNQKIIILRQLGFTEKTISKVIN